MFPVPKNACLKTLGGPLVLSHRGSRGEYDDNSAGGFKWCLENGIRAFETDVHFTKDHELVIMHDSSVARTTDGNGILEEMTLAEVRSLRLNTCSEPVPLASDIFNVLHDRDDIFIELEMKAYPGAFYTPEVLEEYCRRLHDLAKSILAPGTYNFTSFNLTTLSTMRKIAPDAPIGLICSTLEKQHIQDALAIGCCSIAPTLDSSPELIQQAHDAGITLTLWMVQCAADYALAASKGADRVTSDYPHLLLDTLAGKRKKVVAIASDAILCQPRAPVTEDNLKALEALCAKYKCLIFGAENPRFSFNDHPVFIGGSSECDMAEREFNKFNATMRWATEHGYSLDDIIYIGGDFADGGSDSHVRLGGMDHIVVTDYSKFANAVRVLLL